MSKWKRFEEGGHGQRNHLPTNGTDGNGFAVMWDGDPKIYFTSHPNSWGGSGWYADPQDVIQKPESEIN